MAKLKLPANNKAGVGFGGEFYPSEKGYVTVPDEAATELIGFGLIAEDDEEVPKA